jgi:RNA polymerase sigma factor (sigma-70 family)
MEDLELLREYANSRSEQAFAELVRRHVNLVYSTALRLIAQPEKAQEVVQMVFIDLARRANRQSRITQLSGWLYRRTCFAASDILRSDQRRRQRERAAMQIYDANADADSVWQSVAPVLEEAMGHLSQTDQNAIVLRFFENKSLKEVGQCMGLSEDTAQKRVTRALDRLRSHFFRRGITLSLAALAPALAAHTMQAAPAGMAASVATVSVATAGPAGVGILGALAAILTKLKPLLFVLTGLVLVGSAGYVVTHPLRSRSGGGATPARNLVQNGGFEEGIVPWTDTKGTLTVTRNVSHSGTSAALVSSRVATYAGPIQQVPVETFQSGSRHVCSAWVRVQNGSPQPVQITIRYDDDKGTHYVIGARGKAYGDQWTLVRGEFAITPAGSLTFVDLFLEGPAVGVDFLVDDVSVLQQP